MRNLWQVHLELIKLDTLSGNLTIKGSIDSLDYILENKKNNKEETLYEEEIDRLILRKSRESLISEKERLGKEIDSMLAKELELKHKLQKIEVDI